MGGPGRVWTTHLKRIDFILALIELLYEQELVTGAWISSSAMRCMHAPFPSFFFWESKWRIGVHLMIVLRADLSSELAQDGNASSLMVCSRISRRFIRAITCLCKRKACHNSESQQPKGRHVNPPLSQHCREWHTPSTPVATREQLAHVKVTGAKNVS